MPRTFVTTLTMLLSWYLPSVSEIARGDFTLTTLGSFNGANGKSPQTLTLDTQGNVYGVTNNGGINNDGTVFRIAAGSSTITTLASFSGGNGLGPSGVTLDTQGNIYGTTTGGGVYGDGTIFRIAAGTGTFTTLFSFNGMNGNSPQSGLTLDGQGNLYGTTESGGTNNQGSVFRIAANTGMFTSLASLNSNNFGGFNPVGGVILDKQGNIFGTTVNGGGNNDGSIFKIQAGTGTITTLASFLFHNGQAPYGNLTIDSQGNLYGTTAYGGANGDGTIFRVAAGTSTITTIASFFGPNGAIPVAGLTLDSRGNLFGTTDQGGAYNDGTIFEVAVGTNSITTLVSFNGINGSRIDGGLTLDARGNLFGTATGGGASNDGTVFELVNNNAVVPEPASMIALGQATLVGLGLVIRARSRRAR